MIGLDTSAIIDIFKGEEKIAKFFMSNDEPLAATYFSYLELRFGIDQNEPRHKSEEKYYDYFFQSLKVFGIDVDSCKKASEIYHALKRSGNTIEKFDCIIAAALMTNGVSKILTKNAKHFGKINSLEVITY